ncbi:MAG: DNA polymerase I, partial [Muribaculaceae bacterium]|nr:DNA polymerase I [Muribaculaceae bacterium]
METEKRLFLLDAYALIFRAYYALIKMPRITQSGFNTSAIFGFVNTLEEVLRREKPTHIAVCFDPQGPTFRSEAYEDYKGEREATPEDIKLSIPYIKDIIRAYNIPILEAEGFEADDVIGTMAKRAEKEHFTTYMMTPDKDFGQLVTPDILQYKPAYRGQDFELRGEKEVCQRYGISNTLQVIDYLALVGDKIDNIPGCPGVGEVTAKKLIGEYGSVENLIEKSSTLKGAIKKKIEENSEQIKFSKYLATIRTDVPLEATPEDLKRKEPDRARLRELFEELEFRALSERVMKRIESERGNVAGSEAPSAEAGVKGSKTASPRAAMGSLFDFDDAGEPEVAVAEEVMTPAASELRLTAVNDAVRLEKMQMALLENEDKEVGVYAVTVGDNDMTCRWVGTALALRDGSSWWVDMDYAEGRAALLDLLAREDICKVTDSAKLLYVMAARMRDDDTPALRRFYDTGLAHYLLQPDMRHNTELLAGNILHRTLEAVPDLTPKRARKGVSAPAADMDQVAAAAAGMALAIIDLKNPLEEMLIAESLKNLYEEIEAPLVEVLADMELTGVCIDVAALNDAAEAIEKRISTLEKEIWELAGEEFNVGSPAKVGEILFDKLQLSEKAKKTKTGQYSTSEDILEGVAHKNPIVGKILEYRQLKKLLSTYLTALPASINPATGRVHTNYNQTVTAT